MTLPDSRLTVRDGALGIAGQNNTRVGAKVGCSSAGTANAVVVCQTQQQVKDAFGSGPLVEAACYQIEVAGGPVVCVKSPSSTPGAAGAVTATKTGTATLAVTGGAYDAYDLVVVIVQGGATLVAAAATFKYSLDGGRTYSAEIALPASGVYAIPNTGLTLTWTYTSGTAFVAADMWTSTVTGPASTLSEIQLAIDAVLADPQLVFNIHVLGIAATVADAATAFAAYDSKAEGAATNLYRYIYVTMDLPSDTDANIKAAFASLASKRVEVAAGYLNLTSAVNGAAYKRPAGWVSTARAASVPPHEHLGRIATGQVRGVVALVRDEYKTPGLDVARFTTLRTFTDMPGYYVTNGQILAAAGSDFGAVQRRRVMDVASAIVRKAQLRYVNDTIRVSATTGKVLAEEANDIDNYLESALRTGVTSPGYASDVSAAMDRNENMLSSETMKVTYRVLPHAYSRFLEGDIGFINPAIAQI
jgi:hypothetical protein